MNRPPVRITISILGGEVFNILSEGSDFGSDLDGLIANHDLRSLVEQNVRAAIEASDRRTSHPAAVLTGGNIPAHEPGAYPYLSCCGGPRELVSR